MICSPCQEIARNIGQLFECAELENGFIRIRTPYMYPDGDIIDIFYKNSEGQEIISDLGETLRWLDSQTKNQFLSKKQDQVLQDIQLTHGVDTFRGVLLIRLSDSSDLAEAVTRLSQAAIRVGDLWFLAKTRMSTLIADEVAEYLTEIPRMSFERNEKHIGRSGRSWRIDFHTWHPSRSSLIQVLSTGSKAAANTKANNTIAAWADLSHASLGTSPLKFISLLDDSLDIWSPETISQVSEFSDVAYWSKPEEFLEMVAQ